MSLQEKRQRALMNSDKRKHGNCCICKFRTTSDGVIHCNGWPERQKGFCADDDKLPKFAFDDSAMGKYRNGA